MIVEGDNPLPYAAETVDRLYNLGKNVYFITNGSQLSRRMVLQQLDHCGVKASKE